MVKIDEDPALRGSPAVDWDFSTLLPDKIGNVNELRDAVRRELPSVLTVMIASAVNGTNLSQRSKLIFNYATLFPAYAPQLTESWRLLENEFDSQGEDRVSTFQHRQVVYLLIDALLNQTTSEPHQRALTLGENANTARRKVARILDETTQYDENMFDRLRRLKQKCNGFYDETSRELHTSPADKEQNKRQITLLDVYVRLNERGDFQQFVQKYLPQISPKLPQLMVRDKEQMAETILNTPFVSELLRDGELEGTTITVRTLVWAWVRRNNPDASWLMDYFLGRRKLQIAFWQRVVEMYEQSDPRKYIQRIGQNPHQHIFYMESRLADILETLPSEVEIRRKLITAFIINLGVFKKNFPGHPNIDLVIIRIKNMVDEIGGDENFSQALAILEDHKPGVLTLTRQGLTVAGEQTPSAFYVSGAPRPEVAQTATGRKEEQTLVVRLSEVERPLESVLGLAHAVWQQDIPAILAHLNRKLGRTIQDPLDLAAAYERLPMGSVDHIVMPAILPSSHPLADLSRIGVLAVARNGNQVEIVVSPERVQIETGSPRPIILRGVLDEHKELVIAGADEEFDYTSVHLLFKSAAIFAKAEFFRGLGGRKSISPYSRAEVSQINQVALDWNAFAKGNGLPILGFDEKIVGSVVFPLGGTGRMQRAAFLTLN